MRLRLGIGQYDEMRRVVRRWRERWKLGGIRVEREVARIRKVGVKSVGE